MDSFNEEPSEMNRASQETGADAVAMPADSSQTLFPDSPVYEPDEDIEPIVIADSEDVSSSNKEDEHPTQGKRKLSDSASDSSAKIQKLNLPIETGFSQALDEEVSEINAGKLKLEELAIPSTSRVLTPLRSSPRLLKRSNSAGMNKPTTPKTPKSRSTSVDLTRKTPKKTPFKQTPEDVQAEDVIVISSDSSSSRQTVTTVKQITKVPETIAEEISEENDSQNFHLCLSPSPDEDDEKSFPITQGNHSSDPVTVKDREEILNPGKISQTRSEGYNFSDQGNLSQPVPKEFGKSTDQESTDSACSIMDSPEHKPSVASKMISKLSNGNSSTPTEVAEAKALAEDSDSTPDMVKLLNGKGKRGKIDSFRASNTTTPSTISPLQNGHSLPTNTPQIPVFDIHVNHNEDNEFLSLYIVRTDNDVGVDICKEYQRISKRFSIDPYLADVSVSTSPSSVTSTGIVELPNRISFASTVSSSTSTSSNRTSDGNFVVPQPPRKSVVNPSTSVKGFDNLMKKLHDIFHPGRDTADESNRSLTEEKVSVGIQASLSDGTTNGSASPEEVNKLCDKVTPKSSLKKTRVRGRRQIASKTKRALLPTQPEELEYVMNSPEMVPTNGENGNKSPKEEKLSLVATPKSVSKLKQQKRRPTSPRPATPVEIPKIVKTEYPGFAPDTVVLAKWVDKRYYSGKVLEITEPNKYLIKFDDGRSKVLLDEFIIFGDTKRLPLQGTSVYAMVDEEQNYEPGLVMAIEENSSGTVTYNCITDGDANVMVTASELYLTEDQARALKDSGGSGGSAPSTPRARRHNRELDLDNIIQGPRSARTRDKSGTSSARKRVNSPKSPEASTSRGKSAKTPLGRVRVASESSSISESSNSAPAARIEEVAGVEPEVQRTPRKLDGVKAGPTQLKGAAKQNIGKKNSKLNKFENDEGTVSILGPIPSGESKIFSGLHFLLTCTDAPRRQNKEKNGKTGGKVEEKNGKGDGKSGDTEGKSDKESRHYSSEEDSEAASVLGTDTEDLEFCDRPFNKERLKEQLEAGGGIVHSHFDDIPKNKYSVCKLIAPRPSRTAKYICCLAGDVRALSHAWVIASCAAGARQDEDAYVLPAGYSILKDRFISWAPPSGRRNATFFKDKVILLCGDKDTFVKFWARVCALAGASTRALTEEELDTTGALALVTDWDCPHEVQNKANQDNVPLVATTWIVQCLIEACVLAPASHAKFSFMYSEPE